MAANKTPEEKEAMRVKRAEKQRAKNIRRRPQPKEKRRVAREAEATQKVMNTIIKGAENLNLSEMANGGAPHADSLVALARKFPTIALSTANVTKAMSGTVSGSGLMQCHKTCNINTEEDAMKGLSKTASKAYVGGQHCLAKEGEKPHWGKRDRVDRCLKLHAGIKAR